MEEVRKEEGKKRKKKNLNPSSFKKERKHEQKEAIWCAGARNQISVWGLSEVQETGCMEKINSKSRQQSQDQQSEAGTSGAGAEHWWNKVFGQPWDFFFFKMS